MSDQTHERLASLEAKLEFLKELLTEIRDNLKSMPNREEFNEIKHKVEQLERSQMTLAIKVGIASGILGMIGGIIIKFITS